MSTPSPAPVTVSSAPGLRFELNPDGGVRRIQHRDEAVNLFMGNGMEPGPANLWLRLHAPGAPADPAAVTPLLGPHTPLRPLARGEDEYRSAGAWRDLRIELRLALAPDRAAWCWQVRLENRGRAAATVDLVHAQDVALASPGAVRLNEYYVSQYLDLSPLEHPRCGWVVAVRQNLAQGGRHPWAVLGSVRRGVSFATDALQVHGLRARLGEAPEGVVKGLPGVRLQHEHAMPAVQDAPVTLAPGERWAGGFFGALVPDHPPATSAADLGVVDGVLAWAEALGMPSPPEAEAAPAGGAGTLFSDAPALACGALDQAELERHFGARAGWRHLERDGAALLSFFHGEQGHVVLRAKEVDTLRPHGHILRTGRSRVPEEAALTSTAWMGGVFHSMVTQGHVAINRFLSTTHGYLGLFRSHGLRLFVRVDDRWSLLGVPSAFELRPDACRWIYRHARGALEVVSAAAAGAHALTLRARVLDGPPVAWLATLHLALGGDDGNAAAWVPWRVEGSRVVVPVPAGSELEARFPGGAFEVAWLGDTAPSRVSGDGRLFADGRSRGLPFLCVEGEPSSCFGLELRGRLLRDGARPGEPIPLPRLRPPPDGGAASADVADLGEMLPWLLHDARVHHLSPRGLEQYSGGGWGTRDVCQGPLEALLALDCPEAARDLLLRVFAAQNPDGDWPQWFQFIEREAQLRAPDAHGDVVFWPLLALARYVLATGDGALLHVEVPFHRAAGAAPDAGTLLRHVERALEVIAHRRVAGTALVAYGHGDWNDALQPADPAMRERLCSAWTVTLHHQTWVALARALRHAGLGARAAALEEEAAVVRRDFRERLMPDGVIAGYAELAPGAAPAYLLHPRDRRTGLRYSLLPMTHAILEGLCTPGEAEVHLAIMREHLWGPDGARLFDRPLPYRGGVEHLFQRAESAAFFGREIGVMYTHAHLRHAQMLAHVGDARGLLRSLALAHPIGLRERLPQATLRQANCYFSSSDAAFRDRYEAQAGYGRVADGTVALDGGWRIYSSGPGITLAAVVTSFLGLRRDGATVVVDPVVAPALSGLEAELSFLGRRLRLEVRVAARGHGPRGVELNGRPLPFARERNPYRTGGAVVPLDVWTALGRVDGSDVLRVDLG